MISKLDTLFGSTTRVKILSLLILNSEKEFYIKEISDSLGLSYGLVHREIENLKKGSIITERHKGKLRHFKISKFSPIYPELRGLILKTEGLGNVIGKLIRKINFIEYAMIFGSVAKGVEIETSDVDLLIIGNPDEEKIIEAVKHAEKKICRDVNYIIWSKKELVKKVKEKHYLIADIVKGPVIMIIGDEDGFRQIAKR